MLKDLGIKSRVLVLIVLPSTVLAVVLGVYFTWMQERPQMNSHAEHGN